jgi:2-dehydropantoate 2-reductase
LDTKDSKEILLNLEAYSSPVDFEEANPEDKVFDFLFLTTKAYDSESAQEEYKNVIQNCTYFIILQNGIGNEEIVKKFIEKAKIIRAVTTGGALLKEPGHIIHTGKGYTKLGFYYTDPSYLNQKEKEKRVKDLKFLVNLLNQSGLECHFVDDIVKVCWEKVFVNIGINPFAAITRLRNGQLLENEKIKDLMKKAVDEAIKVAKAKGIQLSNKDYVESVYDVARKTYKNQNSMLQDILKGKKTEIDFINGKIVEYAEKLGISVPLNDTLTRLIKGIEYSFFKKD